MSQINMWHLGVIDDKFCCLTILYRLYQKSENLLLCCWYGLSSGVGQTSDLYVISIFILSLMKVIYIYISYVVFSYEMLQERCDFIQICNDLKWYFMLYDIFFLIVLRYSFFFFFWITLISRKCIFGYPACTEI